MGLKIEIEKDLYLEADGSQYLLRKYSKPTINKKGEEVESYVTIGHYGKIEYVFDKLLKMKISESKAKVWKELLNEIRFHREEIRMLLKGV